MFFLSDYNRKTNYFSRCFCIGIICKSSASSTRRLSYLANDNFNFHIVIFVQRPFHLHPIFLPSSTRHVILKSFLRTIALNCVENLKTNEQKSFNEQQRTSSANTATTTKRLTRSSTHRNATSSLFVKENNYSEQLQHTITGYFSLSV